MKVFIALFFCIFSHISYASCMLSDIKITSVKANFVDQCGVNKCSPHLQGVATLENNCPEAIGVQIKITSYDKSGAPVSTEEWWPASIRNIPTGDYVFSLDQYLNYDPSITSFSVKPVAVNRWSN